MTDFTTIGRYEILDEIGRGAMGVVYKARDPVMDRVVAVKTIQTVALTGPQGQQYRDRFYREAQAAARLSHPGIVTVYDAGEQDGMPYLVMEYLRGRTLESALAAGERFSFDRIAELGQQLAEALGYAHRNGVVHRDVKPANILLTAPDPQTPERAKITDLGIAKLTASQITTTGQLLGTPSFMPPEQFIGIPVDGRSDLFSLGVILYWMATGDKPFSGDTITAVSYKIVHGETISPRKLNPLVPTGLETIVMKCLEKDPARRYQTGEDLAQDLAALRSGGIPVAPAPAISTPAGSSDITIMVGDEGGPAMPPPPAPVVAQTVAGTTMRTAAGSPPPGPQAQPQVAETAPSPPHRRSGRAFRLSLEAVGIVVLGAAAAGMWVHRRSDVRPAAPKQVASAANSTPAVPPPGVPAASATTPGSAPVATTPTTPPATPAEAPPPAPEATEPVTPPRESARETKSRASRKASARRAKAKLPVLKPPITPAPVAKTPIVVQPPPKLASTPPPAPKPAAAPPPQPALTPDTGAKLHIDAGRLPESASFVVLMDGKPFFQRKAGQGSAEPLLPPGEHEFQVIAASGGVKLGQSNSVRGQFQAKKKKTLRVELRDNTTGNTVKKDAKLADGSADYVITLK